MKKLYLVKREVLATSVEKALKGKGSVYEIILAGDEFQPKPENKKLGFKKNESK